MLALSIRQPWAALIINGRKSIEIRTWRPPDSAISERILIHTGVSSDKVPPDVVGEASVFEQPRGCIIGSAILIGYKEYTNRTDFVIDRPEHLNPVDWWESRLIGFHFTDIEKLEKPIQYKGQLRFFEVNENDLGIPEITDRTLSL